MTETTSGRRVRVIAIALIRNRDRLLLMAVHESDGRLIGWRPLGGEVEFGERAEDAVKRELIEEIAQPIDKLALRCVLENLFAEGGQPGHEVVFVFDADLADETAYATPRFDFIDVDTSLRAEWVSLDDLKAGPAPLFPVGLLDRL